MPTLTFRLFRFYETVLTLIECSSEVDDLSLPNFLVKTYYNSTQARLCIPLDFLRQTGIFDLELFAISQ